jgi:gliding-associated putative ABC transporter substrate-binding component GldG
MAEQDSQKKPAGGKGRPEMTARKRLSASNATAYVLLTIGAVVAVNLISTRVFGRLDLTENKVYTLSPASRDVVKNLPDYLTVKAYISKDLPPELTAVSRYVRDLLDEYRTYSKGKLRFEAIDPGADKKIADEAGQCGVRPLQIQVLRSQKFEVGSYFMGLCFQYQGKTESVPEVTQQEGLEYQVSSIVKRMTQRKRKLAFTTGHGENDLNQGFTMLKRDLEREFEITTVNPSSASIGDDVDAIVVGGPKQPFDDKGRREIDAYLMKGHGAIFLADGMVLQAPRGGMPDSGAQPKIGQANETGLNELLEKYGFKIGGDFVLDRQNVPGPVEIGGRRMLRNRPEFVGVKVEDDVKDLTVMAGVNILVFPFPSSVELVGPLASGKPATGKLWTLAKTSPDAWKQTGFYFFAPGGDVEEGKEKGRFGLGYAYQGPLHSAFAPTAAPGMSAPETPGSESKQPVRLVVVGDSDFANDEYLQFARYLPFYQGGAQMLFNAISWALEDETLTPVRTKNIGVRPITVDSDAKVALVKVINIACVPLAFIGFGLVRWRLRRSRRRSQTL